jgi:hypothetical protein
VPEQIAERIYRLAGVEPSAEDRASGFWYCVEAQHSDHNH